MFREKLKQAVWQVPLLVITACVIGIAVNSLRPDRLALVGDWSEQARFADAAGESLVIGLDEAAGLFERQAVLFLDARPQNQYAEGHVRGALSLPWQEVDRYFMELTERLESASTIIIYCNGESCDLSHELALFLKEIGYKNVRVLINGWTVWQQAGLPTELGG
ncbi:MAG: rhodanese-like domain-containing protein [Desulfobacterales bacterium]